MLVLLIALLSASLGYALITCSTPQMCVDSSGTSHSLLLPSSLTSGLFEWDIQRVTLSVLRLNETINKQRTRVCVLGRSAERNLYLACALLATDPLPAGPITLKEVWKSDSDQYNGAAGSTATAVLLMEG